jgi:3-phosphoshikimate 1-carboxyvinyltransferase
VRVNGTGAVTGGPLELAGDVSSQFLSGLLLAAPAMQAGLDVRLTTPLVSRPYVELTRSVMAAFGVAVAVGRSAQGDLRFVDVLARMGCEVEVADDATTVTGTGALRGVTVDMADCSDVAQTLSAVAAFADGHTRITGIGFIRRKETDRIAATVAELRRTGVQAEEEPDGLVVRPTPGAPRAARIHTYDDHRMAMSFTVLGLRTPGTVILDPGCVAKTFPGFFDVVDQLGPGRLR